MSICKQVHCEIIALETPKVIRNCHTCKKTKEFYCSEKFRVNTEIEYVITGEQIEIEDGSVIIHLSSRFKFDLRLDKVLKEILGISRSMLYQMVDHGRILTNPQVNIKGKMKEDLQISIVAGTDNSG
jgi:hypothetical protein